MATLDYDLAAVLTGAGALYAGLCLLTGARPAVLFDRILTGPAGSARAPLDSQLRCRWLAVVAGVVTLLAALVVLDRSL